MAMRSTRRIVTGHDPRGKAVVLFDDIVTAKQRGANGVTLFWVTSEFPVDTAGPADRGQTPVGVPPPRHGTVFRVVDFAPAGPHAAAIDHNEILRAMGIDPATQGYARHANTHRTRTIDSRLFWTARLTCCSTTARSMSRRATFWCSKRPIMPGSIMALSHAASLLF